MNDPVFEVTYRVGFDNLNAFFGAWLKRTWFDKTNWKRFGLYALIVTGLLAASSWSWIAKQYAVGFGPFFAVYIAVDLAVCGCVTAFILTFLVGPILTYLAQLATFILGPMGKRTTGLKASPAGVDRTTGDIESQTKWRNFTAVVKTKNSVLLFTHRNSATIVPKSAFASPAEAEAFAACAKAQWNEAHSVF